MIRLEMENYKNNINREAAKISENKQKQLKIKKEKKQMLS